VGQNRRRVSQSAKFTKLSDEEREDLIRRAKRMADFTQCTLAEVARRLSIHGGRAIETIRYTIRNHDRRHPDQAVFPKMTEPLSDAKKDMIYRAFLNGVSPSVLAKKFSRTRGSVYRVVYERRATQLLHREIDYVYNPQFDLPNADEVILEGQFVGTGPAAADDGDEENQPEPKKKPVSIPGDLPPYLKALYRVPLLTPEKERELFRRYNYLKYKADRKRQKIDPERARVGDLQRVESLLVQANLVKNAIIRANLRLVVSIAKKHLGGPQTLFELVSDGNVALMRAVEKFDYARGFRFSTYASWAIMRTYARSVPKERYQLDRFSTGNEEVLDIAASLRTYDPNEMNLPEIRESIDAMLSRLSARERMILADHYGLVEGNDAKTFEQLGDELGISKERVRQIELQALKKLRRLSHPEAADLLS
ncbi:MAG: sigma-70 family RNA polymerase sigma factor, partial [Phycisphaerae bacterium]